MSNFWQVDSFIHSVDKIIQSIKTLSKFEFMQPNQEGFISLEEEVFNNNKLKREEYKQFYTTIHEKDKLFIKNKTILNDMNIKYTWVILNKTGDYTKEDIIFLKSNKNKIRNNLKSLLTFLRKLEIIDIEDRLTDLADAYVKHNISYPTLILYGLIHRLMTYKNNQQFEFIPFYVIIKVIDNLNTSTLSKEEFYYIYEGFCPDIKHLTSNQTMLDFNFKDKKFISVADIKVLDDISLEINENRKNNSDLPVNLLQSRHDTLKEIYYKLFMDLDGDHYKIKLRKSTIKRLCDFYESLSYDEIIREFINARGKLRNSSILNIVLSEINVYNSLDDKDKDLFFNSISEQQFNIMCLNQNEQLFNITLNNNIEYKIKELLSLNTNDEVEMADDVLTTAAKAIIKSNFKCAFNHLEDHSNFYFPSQLTKRNYLIPYYIVPGSEYKQYIDNILALCPKCYAMINHAHHELKSTYSNYIIDLRNSLSLN